MAPRLAEAPSRGGARARRGVPRVLVAGHAYVVGVNQQKLLALGRHVAVGALVPDGWRHRQWGTWFPLVYPPDPPVSLYPARVPFEGRSGAYWYPLRHVRAAVRTFDPDVLHIEQEVFSVAAFEMAVVARLARRPLVVFCWENVEPRLSFARRAMRRFVLRTARLIIAGNQAAGDLLRRWGYRGRLEIMPQLGVDPSLFRASERAGRAGPTPTVGYVGRLVPEKGTDLLLEAAAQARGHGCDLRIVVCGTGPAEPELRALAVRLGIADSVEWRGAVSHDQVPEQLASMDALVLPSRSAPHWQEQFGHVLIEAMAMGVPVIGSTCGAIPEVIGRDDAIFPEGDAAALEALLRGIMTDGDWRADLSAFGRDRVAGLYTHERIADRTAALYGEVLEVGR